MRFVVSRSGLMEANLRSSSYSLRYFSDGKGRVLSEEERAKETVYIQVSLFTHSPDYLPWTAVFSRLEKVDLFLVSIGLKKMERERLEKRKKAELEKAEKEKSDKVNCFLRLCYCWYVVFLKSEWKKTKSIFILPLLPNSKRQQILFCFWNWRIHAVEIVLLHLPQFFLCS